MAALFYMGSMLKGLFDPVLSKLGARLVAWQGKVLSTGAKLTLIKSCLLAISIYYLSLIEPPKDLIKGMTRIISNFFWNYIDGN